MSDRDVTMWDRALGWCTAVATAPYAVLKLSWLAGNPVGLTEPGLMSTTTYQIANLVTVLLDATLTFFVFALTRPFGRYWPTPVILAPIWVATGLLGGATAVSLATLPFVAASARVRTDDDLQSWVYVVVYSGFVLQAALLAVASSRYAVRRWPPADTWRWFEQRRRTFSPLLSRSAIGACLISAAASWASAVEPQPSGAASSTVMDRLTPAVFGLTALITAAGFHRVMSSRRLPKLSAATVWVGTATMATWGVYQLAFQLAHTAAASPATISANAVLFVAGITTAGVLTGAAYDRRNSGLKHRHQRRG